MDFEETISRIGCYYTPLLCQFSSFRKTEHAANESGQNMSLWGSKLREIYMRTLTGLNSSKRKVDRDNKSTFTKVIETSSYVTT